MNGITIASLFLMGAAAATASATDPGARERAFVKALEIFDGAKTAEGYRESAAILESILADGFRNGAVYYNLGNAYFRAGDYGRAILNYRKAKPYHPRDPYLNANLEQALGAAPGRLVEPARPWWSHVLFWTDWISYPTKVHAFFVGAVLAAGAMSLAVILRRPRFHLLSIGLLLASAAIGIDATTTNADVLDSSRAVITAETIARKGTSETYEAAFDQPLRDGAEFHILKETPDWTFGHFEGIGDGWVRNEFVAH